MYLSIYYIPEGKHFKLGDKIRSREQGKTKTGCETP